MTLERDKSLGGRPVVYTEEFINAEADALQEWLMNDDNFYFKRFALSRGYSSQRLGEFAKVNQKFSAILDLAKEWREVRLAEGGLSGKYNAGFTKFIMGNVCGFVDKQQISGDVSNPLSFLLQTVDGSSKDLVDDTSSE